MPIPAARPHRHNHANPPRPLARFSSFFFRGRQGRGLFAFAALRKACLTLLRLRKSVLSCARPRSGRRAGSAQDAPCPPRRRGVSLPRPLKCAATRPPEGPPDRNAMLEILAIVLPVFLVLGLGFGLGRTGFLDRGAETALSRLVFYVAAPGPAAPQHGAHTAARGAPAPRAPGHGRGKPAGGHGHVLGRSPRCAGPPRRAGPGRPPEQHGLLRGTRDPECVLASPCWGGPPW